MEPNVVTLAGKPVEARDLDMESEDALTALRAVVGKMERGELILQRWLFLFEERCPTDKGLVHKDFLDSGLTVEAAVYILEQAKLGLMRAAEKR